MTDTPSQATLLVNPMARRVRKGFNAEGAAAYIRRRGSECELKIPDSAEALRTAARESAARGDDLLFVAGGDGTLRLAAGAIAGSSTALAALPGGTANVWCKEVGLPRSFRKCIDAHLDGQTVAMDLGDANGEPFMLMASLGWDALIARDVDTRVKRATGPAAYGLRGLRMLPSLRTQTFNWTDDEGPHSADCGLMVVSNTSLYGGLVRFSPDASAVDGLLDLCVWEPRGPASSVRLLTSLAAGRLDRSSLARTYRSSSIAIETGGIPMQLDGDPAGETPVRLSMRPGALRVRVPKGELPAVLRP